jgi:hypothetical protein
MQRVSHAANLARLQRATSDRVDKFFFLEELLHVDMFAHNKSGIAYRDGNRRSKTVVNHKREPHQQLRLLPSCTN